MHDPLVGRLIAERYRLITRLGSGGMAHVYLARHVMIERLSAIKFLHASLSTHEASRDRFLREARAVNRLNHPNIVEITDYGESDGLVYLVMEYVPGEPLTKRLESGPLGWQRAVDIGLQVASALGRAHQMGVIHRDLKPANLLLVPRKDGNDAVKLIDFGVAKVVDAPTITTSTIALGTPGYVAPEYGEYGRIDPRSDLYSLGVLLYEATSGKLPYPAQARPGATGIIKDGGFPPSLCSLAEGTPPLFDQVVRTLLARDPDDRPRDGFEAFALLDQVAERHGSPHVISLTQDGDRATPLPKASHAGASLESDLVMPRHPGPRLTTVAFDRVAPLCVTAMRRLDAHLQRDGDPRGSDWVALEEARKLVRLVEGIDRLVLRDSQQLDAIERRARTIRADLGEKLDAVAREHSKSLGWAGSLAERSEEVRSHRDSGEHPLAQMDAMIWEQAALEQEEERARTHADELRQQVRALEDQLAAHNERFEQETRVAHAELEGHVAALRSMALEAWVALEALASRHAVTLIDDPSR